MPFIVPFIVSDRNDLVTSILRIRETITILIARKRSTVLVNSVIEQCDKSIWYSTIIHYYDQFRIPFLLSTSQRLVSIHKPTSFSQHQRDTIRNWETVSRVRNQFGNKGIDRNIEARKLDFARLTRYERQRGRDSVDPVSTPMFL